MARNAAMNWVWARGLWVLGLHDRVRRGLLDEARRSPALAKRNVTLLGSLEEQAGNLSAAIEHYEAAAPVYGNELFHYTLLATLHEQDGAVPAAVEAYRRAISFTTAENQGFAGWLEGRMRSLQSRHKS